MKTDQQIAEELASALVYPVEAEQRRGLTSSAWVCGAIRHYPSDFLRDRAVADMREHVTETALLHIREAVHQTPEPLPLTHFYLADIRTSNSVTDAKWDDKAVTDIFNNLLDHIERQAHTISFLLRECEGEAYVRGYEAGKQSLEASTVSS